MGTYTKVKLSGSTNGRNIKVAATATPGTDVHDAHATAQDELWLFACNSDTVERKLTIELGGVTSPDDTVEITLPPECGFVTVIPGLVLTGGVSVKAFAASGNVVLINGFVNRIT